MRVACINPMAQEDLSSGSESPRSPPVPQQRHQVPFSEVDDEAGVGQVVPQSFAVDRWSQLVLVAVPVVERASDVLQLDTP